MIYRTRSRLGLAAQSMLQIVCFCASSAALSAQAPSVNPVTSPSVASQDSKPDREYGPEDHDVIPPKVIYAPDPEFSDKARKKKLSGVCVFSLLVDTQGNPQDVRLVQSAADGVNSKQRSAAQSLDQKGLEAVKQYRFQPATLHGKPVPYRVKIEVNFRIY